MIYIELPGTRISPECVVLEPDVFVYECIHVSLSAI